MLKSSNDSMGAIEGQLDVPEFNCSLGEFALAKLVISLIDSVKVLISCKVLELGVSGGLSSCLGSSEVSVSGPQVSKSVAMNSCLKSRCNMPVRKVIWFCFFSDATFNACRMSLFCLIA